MKTVMLFAVLVLGASSTIRADTDDDGRSAVGASGVEPTNIPGPDAEGHGIYGLWNKAKKFYGKINQYLDPQAKLRMDQTFGHLTTFLKQVHDNPQEIVQTLKNGINRARQQAPNDKSVKKLSDEFNKIKRKLNVFAQTTTEATDQ